jgi:prepilin-type N-terminal cleavage/methylation domain-containing protein
MKRVQRRRGFTLIESIMVLAILAIVAVMASELFLTAAQQGKQIGVQSDYLTMASGALSQLRKDLRNASMSPAKITLASLSLPVKNPYGTTPAVLPGSPSNPTFTSQAGPGGLAVDLPEFQNEPTGTHLGIAGVALSPSAPEPNQGTPAVSIPSVIRGTRLSFYTIDTTQGVVNGSTVWKPSVIIYQLWLMTDATGAIQNNGGVNASGPNPGAAAPGFSSRGILKGLTGNVLANYTQAGVSGPMYLVEMTRSEVNPQANTVKAPVVVASMVQYWPAGTLQTVGGANQPKPLYPPSQIYPYFELDMTQGSPDAQGSGSGGCWKVNVSFRVVQAVHERGPKWAFYAEPYYESFALQP